MELAGIHEAFRITSRNCAVSVTSTVSNGFIAAIKTLPGVNSGLFSFPVRYTIELLNELMFLALYIKAH
jgi:hypothetical protein